MYCICRGWPCCKVWQVLSNTTELLIKWLTIDHKNIFRLPTLCNCKIKKKQKAKWTQCTFNNMLQGCIYFWAKCLRLVYVNIKQYNVQGLEVQCRTIKQSQQTAQSYEWQGRNVGGWLRTSRPQCTGRVWRCLERLGPWPASCGLKGRCAGGAAGERTHHWGYAHRPAWPGASEAEWAAESAPLAVAKPRFRGQRPIKVHRDERKYLRTIWAVQMIEQSGRELNYFSEFFYTVYANETNKS